MDNTGEWSKTWARDEFIPDQFHPVGFFGGSTWPSSISNSFLVMSFWTKLVICITCLIERWWARFHKLVKMGVCGDDAGMRIWYKHLGRLPHPMQHWKDKSAEFQFGYMKLEGTSLSGRPSTVTIPENNEKAYEMVVTDRWLMLKTCYHYSGHLSWIYKSHSHWHPTVPRLLTPLLDTKSNKY